MPTIVLINKNSDIKQSKIKDLTRDILHTKCGFKNDNDFDKRTTWNIAIEEETFNIELWAKNNARANTENKYDFPPPIDSELYFGTCALLRVDDDDNIIDLTTEVWEKVYDFLFGGFEDLDSEEEPSEDELEKIPDELKTKTGYLKDGFVVSTDSDKSETSVDEDYEDDSEDEESLADSELDVEAYDYSDDEK
jgi:hypothetical protein|tara:strand:+ start:850 stop:1428 length:579 start_codon:yes stop_codon:yes gene_type:complete